MNTDKLARSTVVLDRSVHEDLSYVASRMGISRSALVRDVLSEPVTMMARWVRTVPDHVTPEEVAKLTAMVDEEMGEFIGRKTQLIEGGNV